MKTTIKTVMLLFIVILTSCSKDDATTTEPPKPTSNLAISSISPTSGFKNTTVFITGVDFSPNAISNIVTLNGKPCVVNSASGTTLNITIPRGAGSGKINVTVNGFTVQSNDFEYLITPSVVSTFAGSTGGYLDGTGTAAQFSGPYGIATDAMGNVYVADTENHKIRKITPAGVVTTIAGSIAGFADGAGSNAKFVFPIDVTLDSSGNIYVADLANQRIRKITTQGIVSTIAGDGTIGFVDGPASTSKLSNPRGVSSDPSGVVYVGDETNYRIRKINTQNNISTLAGISTSGLTDGSASIAEFNNPNGIAVDASGNVFVADRYNHAIRKITPTGEVSTIAGGTYGFADGIGINAKFNSPTDVAVDGLGNVYVADAGNNRIRKITATGVVTTIAGSTSGFADGTGLNSKFSDPHGIIVDSFGDIYIAEVGNHKIRKITID
jgi:IPT/TIG domain/NHL repeat